MSVTTDVLSEMLEVNPNTVINWELSLGLEVKTDNSGVKIYSDELIPFFKKVKSLILNGYSLSSVKELLILEVKYHNNNRIDGELLKENSEKTIINIKEESQKAYSVDFKENSVIFLNDENHNSPPPISRRICEADNTAVPDLKNTTEYNNTTSNDKIFTRIKETTTDNLNQTEMIGLFEVLLKELKSYTDRTIEAEKKIFLLEDYERRVKEEYYEIKSEVKQLKVQLEDKEQKLREFEEQKKRLNLMEVQLKIMQLSNNKKRFWEFWK